MAVNRTSTPQPVANVVVLAVVVSLIAVAMLLIIGQMILAQYSLQQKVIDRKNNANNTIRENISVLNSLSSDYDKLGDKQKLIKDALPDKPNFPALVVLIENIAKNSNIKLQSVESVEDKEAKAPVEEGTVSFLFKMSVQGDYTSLKSLLHNLEASAQPMRVTDITVGGSSTNLNVDLTIVTFYKGIVTSENKMETVK